MIFKVKNNNYKNFDIYKENVMQPRSYFIPFSSLEQAGENDFRTERYNSSMVDVLSGEWDFKYYDAVSKVPDEIDIDSFEFDKVAVPSVWQHTGYEKPYYVNARYQIHPKFPRIALSEFIIRFFRLMILTLIILSHFWALQARLMFL